MKRKYLVIVLVLLLAVIGSTACSSILGSDNGGQEVEVNQDDSSLDGGDSAEATPTEVLPTEVPPTEVPPTEVPPTEVPTEVPATYISVDNARDVLELKRLSNVSTATTAAAYSPTEDKVATYGWYKTVYLWDVAAGKVIHELHGPTDYGQGLEFSPDGKVLVVAAGNAYRVYVYDVENGDLLYDDVTNIWARRVSFKPDGSQFVVVGNLSTKARVYDTETGALDQEISLGGNQLEVGDYSPAGDYLALVDGNNNVYILNADNYQRVKEFAVGSLVGDIEFSPDGSLLAMGHRDGSISVYSTENWQIAQTIENAHNTLGRNSGVSDLEFGKGSDVLFSSGGDGDFHIWNIESGAKLKTIGLSRGIWTIKLNGDGTRLVAAMDNGEIIIIGLPD